MKSKYTIRRLLTVLEELYPQDGTCFLNYDKNEPWQLLFATILSAQCTDDSVNQVTGKLFAQFPSLHHFADANITDIETAIRTIGLYRSKAKHLQQSARKLLENHGGILPSDIMELTELNGVGRKTANVVRGHIFNIPSITVDTHVMRISRKLGLTENTCPVRIELDLMQLLPKKFWIAYNQQVISHGRAICTARNPKCNDCKLSKFCDTYKNVRN